MNGCLVVDKPAGITSHDVVARCRRALGERRIGHAGTLDPPATGVLVLGIGRATRLLRFAEDHAKEYVAEVVFGLTTDTLDATGSILSESDASGVTETAVREALDGYTGTIEQIPPMVSAIKVGGERLYKKARRGEEVERAPRTVQIHSLALEGFEPGPRARARLRISCSKGTYIRTLAADIGATLGVGGHVATLRRTRVGPFGESEAVALDEVSVERLRPMDELVAGYPRRDVPAADARALITGQRLPAAGIEGPYAIWGPDGLIAMAEDDEEGTRSLCVVSES